MNQFNQNNDHSSARENSGNRTSDIWGFGSISNKDFERLSSFIYRTFGIRISEKKHYLLQNRLIKRLKELNFNNFTDYTNYVLSGKDGGDEVFKMMDVVSTNKTDFFREKSHFDFLSEKALKDFQGESIRAWSAGCSTGQEAYSLCMILEEFSRKGIIRDYMVYGNDISTRVIEKARLAIFPFKEATAIPLEYRKRYLLKSKDQTIPRVRIISKLREKSRFLWMNLADEIYNMPRDFQFILCRNTLIYFDRESQQKVISHLIQHLLPGGYLFVGHSESLINMEIDDLQLIHPTIYQKI